MTATLTGNGRQLASKTLKVQGLVALILVVILSLFAGQHAALSALCGAAASFVPGLIFARFAFRDGGASKSQQVVKNFSNGAKFKLALTIIIFVVAFKWLQAEPMALFGAFAVTTATQWVALLSLRNSS